LNVLIRAVDIVLASTAIGFVGVDGLAHGEVRCVVVESESLVTTITAEAGLDTINKLLHREKKELASLNEPGTFEGTS
jgi:hypothetical protein